jgi:hypothetical protein
LSDLTLTGWSDTIAIMGGYEHMLDLHIAGDLQAAQGQGGKVMAHYPHSSADPESLWQNPANFNSSGSSHSQSFTPPAGANEMQFSYMVKMDKGWLAYSEPELQWRHPGYTITRKTYALAGRTIATRISGNQEGENGLFYIHSDHASTLLSTGLGYTSVMSNAAGQKVNESEARYLPLRQAQCRLFGGWRTTPSQTITDRGFTGHAHNNLANNDLRLIHRGARACHRPPHHSRSHNETVSI